MKSDETESTQHPLASRRAILVVGYGNTLRGDDAAGPRAAEAVARWGLPGVVVKIVHQLTPELAEDLASASLAIFIDARLADRADAVEVRPIEPLDSGLGAALGHVTDPRRLLALTRSIYETCASSWLYTVPAVDFSVAERLSPATERGVQEVLRRLAVQLGGPSPGGSVALRVPFERDAERS